MSVKGVQSFLGFANFYKRFIKDFSDLVRPLIDLLDKGFIRVSNSLVVALVLFIKKARGGL